jgi:hypothetical protein
MWQTRRRIADAAQKYVLSVSYTSATLSPCLLSKKKRFSVTEQTDNPAQIIMHAVDYIVRRDANRTFAEVEADVEAVDILHKALRELERLKRDKRQLLSKRPHGA